jgi:hypothetical protein
MNPRDAYRPDDPAALDLEILRLRATGLKPRDLANHLGLPLQRVIGALRSEPIPGPKPWVPHSSSTWRPTAMSEVGDLIRSRHAAGDAPIVIARELRVSLPTVLEALRGHDSGGA